MPSETTTEVERLQKALDDAHASRNTQALTVGIGAAILLNGLIHFFGAGDPQTHHFDRLRVEAVEQHSRDLRAKVDDMNDTLAICEELLTACVDTTTYQRGAMKRAGLWGE